MRERARLDRPHLESAIVFLGWLGTGGTMLNIYLVHLLQQSSVPFSGPSWALGGSVNQARPSSQSSTTLGGGLPLLALCLVYMAT